MNWKDMIIRSIEWALIVSIMILSGIMVMYGVLTIVAGMFKGIILLIVLGLILLIAGLMMIYLMGTISGYCIDSNMDNKDKEAQPKGQAFFVLVDKL